MANEAKDVSGISMYEMLRSAKLYAARENDTPLTESQIQWFFKGYDAHESAIRTAADEAIERLKWIVTACTVDRDAKHELESVIDDLKAALATGKEKE